MEKGICHICGKNTDLTFEHIPPNKAYNDHIVKMYNGEDFLGNGKKPWDFENTKYKYSQRGSGLYSLCKNCNNITGKWYANEYIKISNSILEYILNNGSEKATGYEFKIKNFYPLRFFKQVFSMFASTFSEQFISQNIELKKFLLDKDYNILDTNKYRISIYILKTTKNAWTGINILGDSNKNTIRKVANLDLFPLGFEFEINPMEESDNVDISQFANNYKYDDKIDLKIVLPVRERNSIFPCDYRTKEELELTAKHNKQNIITQLKNEIGERNIDKNELKILFEAYKEDRISTYELYNKVIELINN